jgi:hypothetical protein
MADETNSNLTPEQMAARIAELEDRLTKGSSLSFKVSEKGVYRCMVSVDSRDSLSGAMGRAALPYF